MVLYDDSESSFEKGDEEDCHLLAYCEQLESRYSTFLEGGGGSTARAVLFLSNTIKARWELSEARQQALLDLVLEIGHLKQHGCYRQSDVEVARLIACVSNDPAIPGWDCN